MSVPKPSDWERWCDNAHTSWDYLAKTGPEMIRLAKMPTTKADGYPGGGTTERVQGGSELTPTERAANARGFAGTGESDDHTPIEVDDWVLKNIGAAINNAKMAKAYAARAEVLFRMIEARADERAGRHVTGGDCLACFTYVSGSTNDRLRSGYCNACRMAFKRWGEDQPDPGDHLAFRRERRRDLAEQALKPNA